jgi:tRNA(fMet)-specific endonuclease VapC
MTRYLLDTGHAGAYAERRHNVYQRAGAGKRLGDEIGICTPVLGELWFGIELSAYPVKGRSRLLRALPDWKLWPFTEDAAEEFGRLFALLRRSGRPVGAIDVQVAAIALTLGNCTVVTKDSDFKAIPGLTVEDWSIP